MENRETFSFEAKQKVATLSLQELSKSQMITKSNGDPISNRPVQASDLLTDLHYELDQIGIVYEQEDIIVRSNNSNIVYSIEETKMPGFDRTAPAPFNRWLFHKLITRIVLPQTGDLDGTVCIAYNPHGIQIAFGLNYKICSNMCIMGGNGAILSTGKNGYSAHLEFYEVMEKVKGWMKNFQQNFDISKSFVDIMINSKFSEVKNLEQLLGKLYMYSIISGKGERTIPFLKEEMHIFALRLIERINKKKLKNIWELYNIGTDVLKAENDVSLDNIIPANKAWGDFLLSRYCGLPEEELNLEYIV